MTERNPKQEWNPRLYDGKHAFVAAYGKEMLAILDPGKDEGILDLGCGTGDLTHAISEIANDVVGLDNSPEMIGTARAKYPALRFASGDIRDFDLGRSFDAIFSNAVLHWIPQARAAVVSMHRHLRDGGRLVAEFGGQGCNAAILNCMTACLDERGVRHPKIREVLYYPSISEYSTLLEHNGFEVSYAALFDRPTRLTGGFEGLSDFVEMFYSWVLGEASRSERLEILDLMKARLEAKMFVDGSWIADYRRIRVVAIKKARQADSSE